MSNFRFGFNDYRLNYYPSDATDGMGGVDWDNVKRVEIEHDMYVKERTCEWLYPQGPNGWLGFAECSNCGYRVYEGTIDEREWTCCPNCGAVVKE